MKKLLNTLYVTSEDSYLSLDGENIVVLDKEREIGRLPLHNLEGIVSFGYRGISTSFRFSVRNGSCAFLCISSPVTVCTFSAHCCSIWIKAHCLRQNRKCWMPEIIK